MPGFHAVYHLSDTKLRIRLVRLPDRASQIAQTYTRPDAVRRDDLAEHWAYAMRRMNEDGRARANRPPKTPTLESSDAERNTPATLKAIIEGLQHTAGNAAVNRVLDDKLRPPSTGGAPLEPSVKAAGQRRLASDLDDVRVHTDSSAAEYADALNAQAVTVGQDIFLGPGAKDQTSSDGRATLMHELVHTIQAGSADREPVRGISSPGGAAETEAASFASLPAAGAGTRPSQVAPAGVAHRKVAEEDEEQIPDQPPVPDLLNPAPLTDDEKAAGPQSPKAGELGANEAVAYEIRVLAPFRRALAAVEEQDWETALARIQEPGQALFEYELALEKRDPGLAAEMRGIRGWLALAANQIKGRLGNNSFTDAHITELVSEGITDLEKLSNRLG